MSYLKLHRTSFISATQLNRSRASTEPEPPLPQESLAEISYTAATITKVLTPSPAG